MSSIFTEYGIIDPISLKIDFKFDNLDSTKIVELCKENELDGLLTSELALYYRQETVDIPVSSNGNMNISFDVDYFNAIAKMKLYNSKGELLIYTKHGTQKGNSYFRVPSTDKVIYDATKGALKRIAKEMGLKRQRQKK